MSLKTKTKANSKELFAHAFNMMKMLNANAITIEEAKEQANLVKQCNNILRYELDRAVAEQKFEGMVIREIEDK
jgi:hypothetical protein